MPILILHFSLSLFILCSLSYGVPVLEDRKIVKHDRRTPDLSPLSPPQLGQPLNVAALVPILINSRLIRRTSAKAKQNQNQNNILAGSLWNTPSEEGNTVPPSEPPSETPSNNPTSGTTDQQNQGSNSPPSKNENEETSNQQNHGDVGVPSYPGMTRIQDADPVPFSFRESVQEQLDKYYTTIATLSGFPRVDWNTPAYKQIQKNIEDFWPNNPGPWPFVHYSTASATTQIQDNFKHWLKDLNDGTYVNVDPYTPLQDQVNTNDANSEAKPRKEDRDLCQQRRIVGMTDTKGCQES